MLLRCLGNRMMISWSKCRPLNRSCAEVGSVIPQLSQDTGPFNSLHQNPRGSLLHLIPEPEEKASELLRDLIANDTLFKNAGLLGNSPFKM